MTAAAPEGAATEVGAAPRVLMARGPFKDLPREVGVLSAVAFFVALGFGIVAPAIPVFARHFGVSRTAAGAVISAFALMRLVSALGVGRLVNRIGARLVLGTGIVVVAVSSALAGLAQSYGQLIVLRGVGGVGSAMFTVSASAVLLGATESSERGRSMGAFSGGFLVGGIAGPALGGVVTGISLRAPFFLYAGTLAAAGGVGVLLLPRKAKGAAATTATKAEPALDLRSAFRLPAFRAAAAANLADSWASLGVRSSLVPLFVTEGLHEKPWVTGAGFVVFTAGNVLTLTLGGRTADKRGRKPLLIGGCLGAAAGTGLLVFPPSLPLYFLGLLVFGLGSGLLDVAPGAMLGDVTGGQGGTVIAAFQMAGDVGSLSGPLLAGALADAFSFGAGFGATAAILAIAGFLAALAPETLTREG
ncbi:MAG TPA: MFS transporter [Mycobacteriales bacterium]|nr:MFS transporter [Mycobacteriales bacterium]